MLLEMIVLKTTKLLENVDENVRYLTAKVKPLIEKQDTVMRNAITPEARILLSDKTRTVCVCGRVDTRVWLGISHTRTSQ